MENNIITRQKHSFDFRFQPLVSFRRWHDFDVSLVQFTTDEYETGQVERFFTICGLGFGIIYHTKVKLEKEKEKTLEEVSADVKENTSKVADKVYTSSEKLADRLAKFGIKK